MNAQATLPEGTEAAVPAPRILVVEDERIVARSLRIQLAALGYDVVGNVASGEEAIQQSGDLRPHLVLMDIRLEGAIDGVEAAATIRRRFQLPVIYLTAFSTKEILERAKVTQPFGYVLKPFVDRELHVVIELALHRHRMERQQQERENWFVATLQSIGDAVVAADDEGRVSYMNPLAERLTGWSSEDAIGESFDEVVRLVHEDSREGVATPLDQTRFARPNAGILLIARDCSEIAIEDCVSLIKDNDGIVVGKVIVFRDVTGRNQLEEQNRHAKRMEAMGELAAGAAHALSNLMTVVLDHSEFMLDHMTPGDEFYANAMEIKRSAKRTADLTQKLLAFGRKQNLRLRSVDLSAVVRGLAPILRAMLGGIQLDLVLEAGLGLTKADPNLLGEAVVNLVRNAREAMPEGGRVTIQTANVELGKDYNQTHPEVRPGPYVLLTVSDTGVGMGLEALRRRFEPFFTHTADVGAGLGLAAVYGFIKQCGGDIEIRSQPEKGATFRLYLPREVGLSGGS